MTPGARSSARMRLRMVSMSVVVNRVGFETGDIRGNAAPGKGLEFWGGSFFCDPFGRVVAEGSHDKEEILLGEVDLRHLEDVRRNWPFCVIGGSTLMRRLPAGCWMGSREVTR